MTAVFRGCSPRVRRLTSMSDRHGSVQRAAIHSAVTGGVITGSCQRSTRQVLLPTILPVSDVPRQGLVCGRSPQVSGRPGAAPAVSEGPGHRSRQQEHDRDGDEHEPPPASRAGRSSRRCRALHADNVSCEDFQPVIVGSVGSSGLQCNTGSLTARHLLPWNHVSGSSTPSSTPAAADEAGGSCMPFVASSLYLTLAHPVSALICKQTPDAWQC